MIGETMVIQTQEASLFLFPWKTEGEILYSTSSAEAFKPQIY